MPEFICEQCGGVKFGRSGRKFCSHSCYIKHRTENQEFMPYEFVCDHCGRENILYGRRAYKAKHQRQRFCNMQCKYAHGHSDETKNKISQTQKSIENSGRYKKGDIGWNKGKKMSPETVERMRKAQNRPEVKKRKKEAMKGVPRPYAQGKNHPRWSERSVTPEGYIKIKLENGRFIYEHRWIAGQVLGRPLKKNEVVHHINGDKADNRNCNLLVTNHSFHAWIHKKMEKLYVKTLEDKIKKLKEEIKTLTRSGAVANGE